MAENMWHELLSKGNRKVRPKIREMPHIFCGLCANVLGKQCTIKFQPFRIFLWRCGPPRVMAFSLVRFLDHTQRRTIAGGTPLDEWSTRRRDLCLTTHNTHNRQTSMPRMGFKPTIPVGEWPQTYALDGAATGTGHPFWLEVKIRIDNKRALKWYADTWRTAAATFMELHRSGTGKRVASIL